jgi:hypothetical protein
MVKGKVAPPYFEALLEALTISSSKTRSLSLLTGSCFGFTTGAHRFGLEKASVTYLKASHFDTSKAAKGGQEAEVQVHVHRDGLEDDMIH